MTAPLRFLADESCDFTVVRALRAQRYDGLAVSEFTSRSVDRELIEQAHREERVLLTEDKDFGALVIASHLDSAGVILIRYPSNVRSRLGETIAQLVAKQSTEIAGAFVVAQPGQIRISKKPE